MANYKRRARKRSGSKNFVALPIRGSVALLTLADNALVKSNVLTGVFTEDFYAISIDIQCDILGLTNNEGIPHNWGINHSDYSVAEVTENLDVSLLGPGSKIEQERTRRLVRKGGILQASENVTILRTPESSKRVTLRFMINDGFALEIWVRNRSGSALTTGASFNWFGDLYGRWVT